ncbi:MAG TPA: HDOD domain-containing protein [Solirubrobacteraceae bacterium]|nr:HDOD domain-containing protein [Solirubrobacteraceae bacterium]
MAFDALNTFPALAESRRRLLSATADGNMLTADVVAAIESDASLCIAVLRAANAREHGRGRVETAVDAVPLLRPRTIQALASRVPTFDFFERVGVWDTAPEQFRLHAQATQRAAARVAAEVNYAHRDRLAVTSLLHDIGKLVLIRAYPGYLSHIHHDSATPSKRAGGERAELGIDHAAIGGVVIRRWGLPTSLATTIEQHHSPEAGGDAAVIRLADMLAHHEHGEAVAPRELLGSAHAIGLGPDELRRLMYELPGASHERQLPADPCPLTGRELGVLQQLGRGRVYKEIAHELGLSTSTVRTHLHNIYRKLGVDNRAQAVLFATGQGWL